MTEVNERGGASRKIGAGKAIAGFVTTRGLAGRLRLFDLLDGASSAGEADAVFFAEAALLAEAATGLFIFVANRASL